MVTNIKNWLSGTLIASSKMGITIFDLFTEILTKEWFFEHQLLTVASYFRWLGVIYLSEFILRLKITENWLQKRCNCLDAERITLRVVPTQTILFLQSMLERVGSDIERLWTLNDNSYLNRLKSFWIWCHLNSDSFYVGSDSYRHWIQK